MATALTENEQAQLMQTIEMFEVITQSQPQDYQSLEILKEAYSKLNRQGDVVNTSKRIADAYVQLGQLSSAILEYESILQQFPDDPVAQAALADIEGRASNFSGAPPPTDSGPAVEAKRADPVEQAKRAAPGQAREVDDGRGAMQKVFVEGKLLGLADFNLYWPTPDLKSLPGRVTEPFIQVLADKGLVPLEQSLRALSDRSRLGYLPIEKYDVDVEVARAVPKGVCLRWCVLPFDRLSKSVLVATVNPFNRQANEELEEALRQRVQLYLVPPHELVKVIGKIIR